MLRSCARVALELELLTAESLPCERWVPLMTTMPRPDLQRAVAAALQQRLICALTGALPSAMLRRGDDGDGRTELEGVSNAVHDCLENSIRPQVIFLSDTFLFY